MKHNKRPTVYSEDLIKKIRNIAERQPTRAQGVKAIASALGITERSAQRTFVENELICEVRPPKNQDISAEIVTDDTKNLEDVLAICNVNEQNWNVKSFAVDQKASGKFTWRVSFDKKKPEVNDSALLDEFIEKASQHAPKKWNIEKPSGNKDCVFILAPVDLHLQKLCWAKAVGADYDLAIAKQVFNDAISDLMKKVPVDRVEKIAIVIGSDFFHTDTEQNTTTAGTHVDVDSRWEKAFSEGCDLIVDAISALSQKIPVTAIVIQGNHDKTRSYYLGAYLSAWFRNNKNVTINNAPTHRKYLSYGKTLVGFSHGNNEKLKSLPMIMMRENQETISNHKYMEFLVGHRHIEAVEETLGVKVRTCSSLCPADGWHSEKGYVANVRTCQGFLYSKNHGIEAIYYSKPVE